MVTGYFVFWAFLASFGASKTVFTLIFKKSRSQNAKLYHKINYIVTKYHPCPCLRKKENVLNCTLMLFLEHALKHVFRT